LEYVTAKQPEDQVAKRILDALTAAENEASQDAEQIPPPAANSTDGTSDAAVTGEEEEPEPEQYTDLVGKWVAKRGDDQFGLIIDENAKFTWVAIPKGQERVTLTGDAATEGDTLLLESAEQGTMAGVVKSGGPDKFQFIVAGGPPDDEGLTFNRVQDN
jgi:hypothetical protein